jgi:hypothetical protein
MASRTQQHGTKDSSNKKPMSDMDPEGMDSEYEGEDAFDASRETADADRRRGEQTQHAGTADSQDKANQNRSRRAVNPEESEEEEDEEEQDMEPRSTPRPSSHEPAHNRRESDRNRPSQPGDRRR